MGPWKGTLVFWGSPLTLSMGALRASMSSQWLPMVLSQWLLFSLCVLSFCNSSIQKSEQHQIWAREDSPIEYDKRTGIKTRWLLQAQGQILSVFKTFYFVQYGFGGITFLKIFHKILFTLITEFFVPPPSYSLHWRAFHSFHPNPNSEPEFKFCFCLGRLLNQSNLTYL